MFSNFNNNLSNSYYNNYLSNCDLVNKYNLKNINLIPKLDKITLELDLKDFLNSYEISSKDQSDSLIQTKAFLLLYGLTGTVPHIKASKSVSSSGRQKVTALQYSLKVVLDKNNKKTDFLFSLFVENWHKLKLEDFKIFNAKPNKTALDKKFVLNTLLPGHCLFDIEEFLSKSLTGVNSKSSKFRLNFHFDNSSFLKNRNNIILNLPFFWISGRVV